MPMKPKRMLRYLQSLGIQIVKGEGKGGHQKFFNEKTNRTTEVPMHPRELSKWEEHIILQQAGLLKTFNVSKK